MRGQNDSQMALFYTIDVEAMVPAEHPLRGIKRLVDRELRAMRGVIEKAYSHTGRPGIPAEQLIKASLLQALFSIRSERQLCEQINYNMLYRWFLDLPIDGPVWNHSTFSKNRDRFVEHGLMARFFQASVVAAIKAGEELFARRRDLLITLDMVFFDTTSIYFEGRGGEARGRHGFSKDHPPDLRQLVVSMVLDDSGTPICSQIVPVNATDVRSLLPVKERLERQFAVERVCLVANRGMISAATLAQLEGERWPYILGARLRQGDAAIERVLADDAPFEEVFPKVKQSKAPSPLRVKEVRVGGRRYVVCLNEDQATKDRHDREAIIAALEQALKAGDKALIGNKGFRRYVRARGERLAIDMEKVRAEARYDGLWVLATNTELPAREVALKYKQLWMVEDAFRSMESLLETRPVWHKRDEAIVGHVFCSFLALLLRKPAGSAGRKGLAPRMGRRDPRPGRAGRDRDRRRRLTHGDPQRDARRGRQGRARGGRCPAPDAAHGRAGRRGGGRFKRAAPGRRPLTDANRLRSKPECDLWHHTLFYFADH